MSKEKPKSIWKHYVNALKGSFSLFFVAAISYAISSLLSGVISPIYYKKIIDSLTGNDHSLLLYFFFVFFSINLLQLAFNRGYEYAESYFLSRAMGRLASYGLEELTRHSYQFFADSFTGSLVTKTRKFVSAFETMTDVIVLDFMYAAINIVGILFVLSQTSKILTVVAFGWFAIFITLVIFFTKKRIPLEKNKSNMDSKVTGVISDIMTNVLNLKIFSSKTREEGHFKDVLHEDDKVRRIAWDYANNAYTIQGIVTVLAQASLIYTSILLWQNGSVTAGTIVLVMSYSGTLFSRLNGLGSSIRRFFDAYSNAEEFVALLNKDIEIKDPAHPQKILIEKGEIVFHDVTFQYKQGQTILKDFNLTIKAGERVGVIGTSGAGKTTLTKLLLRFADVTDGAITIDGQDLRHITQDDLRSVVSYVPQDPILFHRSLRENIAYGKPAAEEDEIILASKQAHADDFIASLEKGYGTLVGERGIKLSGGERQRVAIARAILKNAPILILDEATSALDSVSESYIKEALDVLMRGKTTIVVAHRLSTIEKMDRIIVMEMGKIVEEGTHKELLEKKGVYHNFWSHQNKGFIK